MNIQQLQELHKLQVISDYPSLSIISPTHRTFPDNAQDPIRVKNLVSDATSRLLEEFPEREVEPLLKRLNELVENIDWRHTLDGLALFVNKEYSACFDLPFPVTERTVIDYAFATRDLIFAINRSPRYRVLVLSEQPTRLFDGLRDGLQENTSGAFPMEHSRPGGALNLPGGHDIDVSSQRIEHDRHFFRDVDNELSTLHASDELPIILIGTARNLAIFEEMTSNSSHIVGRIEGGYNSTPQHELGQLAWPVMQQHMATQRQKVLSELGEAVGAQKYAAGISEVWQLAYEGRGDTLLIEEDFQYAGILDESGVHLSPAPTDADQTLTNYVSDAVDVLVTIVLGMGGRVVFVENGALKNHAQIAMILRY